MTFQQAEIEIRALLPEADLVSMYYTKRMWNTGYNRGNDIECSVNYCMPGAGNAERADAETWQGVIDKLKIQLMPKGTATSEEEPDAEQPQRAKGG